MSARKRPLARSNSAASITADERTVFSKPGIDVEAPPRRVFELARDRNIVVDAALAEQVALANSGAATATRSLGSFTRGLVTGEPEDFSGLAGTVVGDLFVFGDIRDAVREGARLAGGQETDQLILGLACVGLAVTAGTYATVGAGAPARVGLTVLKAAGSPATESSKACPV